VRGEGAVLLDKNFNRFTDELKPRDVVTKAILKQMEKDGTDFVWLDMRPIDKDELKTHFPGIVEHCKQEGYDVFSECIPIVPSQHYFMGGIRSDLQGKTTKPRLYAVGETCCNGVHGKNRLASNSLLESLLFAKRAGQDINANYKKIDLNKAKAVRSTMDDSKYDDAVALLKQYKQQEITEIAKDKERKR
jgi:L-aspartate oxidase